MADLKRIPQADLAAMQAREEAATGESWEIGLHFAPPRKMIMHNSERVAVTGASTIIGGKTEANANFIAHARTDQPRLRVAYEALLVEWEKSQAELKKKDKKIQKLYDENYAQGRMPGGAH